MEEFKDRYVVKNAVQLALYTVIMLIMRGRWMLSGFAQNVTANGIGAPYDMGVGHRVRADQQRGGAEYWTNLKVAQGSLGKSIPTLK